MSSLLISSLIDSFWCSITSKTLNLLKSGLTLSGPDRFGLQIPNIYTASVALGGGIGGGRFGSTTGQFGAAGPSAATRAKCRSYQIVSAERCHSRVPIHHKIIA